MTPAARQIVFINTAHTITHYSLLILPTAVLAMAVPGGPFGEFVRPDPGAGDRHVRALRPAVAAAGLAGAAVRPQGADDGFFLGTGASLAAAGLAHSPVMLAVALACAGGFAAIYHPIGTTMLVEAAGDKPGRAIGVNGVFGNLGVALAPVVTAFLANQSAGAPPSSPRACCAPPSGCCGCARRWPMPAPTPTPARSRRSRATWSAERCSC